MKSAYPIYRTFIPRDLPKDPTRIVPGAFYHYINPKSRWGWYPIYQFSESGMLQSPNYIASWDPNFAAQHQRIENIEISDLEHGTCDLGGLSPMEHDYIHLARLIRRGHKGLRIDRNYIKKKSDIELKFEEVRRRIAPDAVSRLNSIYVADNEKTLRHMFPQVDGDIILKVSIYQKLNLSKVDFGWYDMYWHYFGSDDEYWVVDSDNWIEKYWKGFQFKEHVNNWEYLVDGLIVSDDPDGLGRICALRKMLKI